MPEERIMGEGLAFIDGEYLAPANARISVFDPGFTHSDAVYDVISAWKGNFFRLDEHLARFQRSCRGFSIACPYDSGEIRGILANCVHRGGVADAAYVAIVATRGHYIDEQARRTRDIFRTRPTFIAYALPYMWVAEPAAQDRGLAMIVAKTPRIPDACVDAKFKNYHWADLTQGKFEARAAGADVAVHLTLDGYLTEGAGYNVFFVRNRKLFTPARNVLEGVTRQSAMDLGGEMGIPCVVGDFVADDLRQADEAFITSTAGGIMPVGRIDGVAYGDGRPGPVSSALRAEYWRRREAGWLGTPVISLLAREGVSAAAR
jgi:branched-chain amino acid aminotransferase